VGREKKSLKLPAPPPDYVAYKWKDGVYVGYDWKNPLAKAAHERRERGKMLRRARRMERRKGRERELSCMRGTLPCCGRRFICPKCEKAVRYLFFPVGPTALAPMADLNEKQRHRTKRWKRGRRERWEMRFLCKACHGVRCVSFMHVNAWNEIVAYLSGGLLYGREVPRQVQTGDPARRRQKYKARPTYWPSERREAVLRLLREGLSVEEMAQKLGRAATSVYHHVKRIQDEHGVKTRGALARKLGFVTPSRRPKQDVVERMLLEGRRLPEIGRELGLTSSAVAHLAQRICARFGVRRWGELRRRVKHDDIPSTSSGRGKHEEARVGN
jgi:DNA-binding NarL/FixJ family response regulator